MHPRLKKYFDKHPLIEIYKGYEIRGEENNSYIVDAALAIYSMTTSSKKYLGSFVRCSRKEISFKIPIYYLPSKYHFASA